MTRVHCSGTGLPWTTWHTTQYRIKIALNGAAFKISEVTLSLAAVLPLFVLAIAFANREKGSKLLALPGT